VFIVSVIILSYCRSLQFLHQMFNVYPPCCWWTTHS